MDGIQVRFAEPREAGEIATLFFSSFPPEVGQLLIYGCKGAAEYIRVQLGSGLPTLESAYFVALKPEGVVGAAELRRQSERLVLNYIAVHPGHRKQRVGSNLLFAALRILGATSRQVELDVLHDNVRALKWYSRLGFVTKASTEFLELAPPSGADGGAAYIEDLPQADSCQERFGFSKFMLISRNGTFSVGRIGDRWFRLGDPAAVGDPSIFGALKQLDPRRRIFAVVPASSVASAQIVRLLAKTHRMEAEILHLMSLLSDDCEKSRELL